MNSEHSLKCFQLKSSPNADMPARQIMRCLQPAELQKKEGMFPVNIVSKALGCVWPRTGASCYNFWINFTQIKAFPLSIAQLWSFKEEFQLPVWAQADLDTTSTPACKRLGRKAGGKFKFSLAFIQPEFPNRKTKARRLWVKFPRDRGRLVFQRGVKAQSGIGD